ncbi:MAG: alpha/beta hydrolase fold domain-containing protein [Pyrinomonadaceae bacterium]|nr:alpha/beta hydrolase fold domain-containing protein [Pyrinomonadaceae bacterium]
MKISAVISMILLLITANFAQNFRDEFKSAELDQSWNFVRNLDKSRWTLSERTDFLRLKGSTVTLDDLEVPPVYVGRKVSSAEFEATTQIDFQPKSENETAGFVLRQNERAHYEFGIRKKGNERELFLRFVIGSVRNIAVTQTIPTGSVKLKIRGFPKYYRFSYSIGNDDWAEIGGVETKPLEGADLQIGLFASGNGIESKTTADFDWFDYNAAPKDPYANIAINDPSLPKGYTIFSVDTAEKGAIQKYPFITRPSSKVPENIEFQKGLVYAKYGEREMHVDLFKPKGKGKFPAVIIVHGGAWITGHYTMENPLAIALAQRGYVAVTVEHRLSNEKKYPAQIHDLKASVRWLRANAKNFGIDENRIGAVGASSGGHLVAFLGVTNDLAKFEGNGGNTNFSSRVQSVVDIDGTATFIDPGNIEKEIKGPYDTNTRLTGFTYAQNPEIWKEASPITHVYKNSAPTLFLNSSSNRPFQQREEMCAKLNALGITSEIIVVPDTPHPFWLFKPWFDVTVENIDKFFKKTLRGK